MSEHRLRDWTPIRVRTDGLEPIVHWAVVDGRFSEPFFEQTADRAMRHPFNRVFAQETALAPLEELGRAEPGLAPTGFIFHMSRCGSTLVAQMLAALPSAIVLAEAQPLDALLTLGRRARIDGDTIAARLRAMIGVLSRPRFGERHLVVKFNAWHVHELPLIARAFPNVPWIFLFREPRAVLRSQAKVLGVEAVPGTIDPAYLGIDTRSADLMPQEEYAARAVASFCAAALRHGEIGRARFVDYAALPDVVGSELLDFFGIPTADGDAERMRAVARRDSKRADTAFEAAEERTDPEIERLAAVWLDADYAALRARSTAS